MIQNKNISKRRRTSVILGWVFFSVEKFWWGIFIEKCLRAFFGGKCFVNIFWILVETWWNIFGGFFWADQMRGFFSCHSLSLPSSSEEEWRLDYHHPQPISAYSPVSIPHSTLPTPLPLPSPSHLTSSYTWGYSECQSDFIAITSWIYMDTPSAPSWCSKPKKKSPLTPPRCL